MIPPHIYEEILRNGTPDQQRKAAAALERDRTIREFRARRSAQILATRRRQPPTATGQPPAQEAPRSTYDAKTQGRLPGDLLREEDAPATGDEEGDSVHRSAGLFRDYLKESFDRNGMDDQGIAMLSSVRWDDDPKNPGYGNAVMNGEQTAYGQGDELFHSFATILDISVHEWAHMLTLYTANLDYWGQPGAGNEGMSDRFAMVLKQMDLRQSVREADWLVGAGIWREHIHNGTALRSFKDEPAYGPDPLVGTDPQPKHMDLYYDGFSDNGGVHINSGIMNHAAYVTALELGGNLWEKAGAIWYHALTTQLGRASDFQAQAAADFAVAGSLFGRGSLEAQAVTTGYLEVGLRIDDVPPPLPEPDDPSPCPAEVKAAYRRLLQNPQVFALLGDPDLRKLLAYGRARARGRDGRSGPELAE